MNVVGIIAEYNPFHNGHKYQIEQAKLQTNADLVIVAMSGNFLQRGVPAMFDKWTRANWALRNGADLVVELPVAYCVQAADYFAYGGTTLLNKLGVDTLVFGVESGSKNDFNQAARWFNKHETLLTDKWNDQNRDQTYSQVMIQSLEKYHKAFPIDLSEPNNTLGFAYTKQLFKHKFDFDILPIKRESAHYHDAKVDRSSQFASATAIRNQLNMKESVSEYVPKSVYKTIHEYYQVVPSELWPFIQYKVWSSPDNELKKIYEMDPGLEVKFKQAAINASSYEEFTEYIKSKHLTFNKINRLIIYSLLNMTKSEIKAEIKKGPEYARILAVNKKGQTYLNESKKSLALPLITNVTAENEEKLRLDIEAGELYRLINPSEILKQDFTRNPYQTIDNKASNQYTK